MQKKLFTVLAALIALAGTLVSATGVEAQTEDPGEAGGPAAIRLQAGTFHPAAGESLALPPGLTIASHAVGTRGYYIVQLDGPVTEAAKATVTATGAELLDYLPDDAFKVRMNRAQRDEVEALDAVTWVGIFQPAYKLSGDIASAADGLYRVRIERGANAGLATAAVASTGATIITRSDSLLMVAADSFDQVEAMANVVDVAWISPFRFKEKHNEVAGGVIMGANTPIANGYDGSSQVAAVADTGIGDGTAAGAHPDIPASRIVSINDWSTANARGCYRVRRDGAQDVDSGHGTHVAVSVLGDGYDGAPAGLGRGVAPAADLVFQATEEFLDTYSFCSSTPDGYYLVGLPDDLHDLYQQAYDDGARIHANSWGSSAAGEYTIDAVNTDDFIFTNPDMTITFSAGNAGVDANNNGVIDDDSIGPPGTAKNVITVGASENDRPDNWPCDTNLPYASHDAYQSGTCSAQGGTNTLGTYGDRYGITVGPYVNDPTAGNAEQMASWSSRGPTDDGRIKPDIVAPGTWILSGFSSLYQEGYGDPTNPRNGVFQWDGWGMPINDQYKYMGGTSMSNPLAAGAATVVRDYYQKAESHSASAALVKATLINSAVDLADENNDGANDNDYPIPNIHEGWGRVDVNAATDDSHVWVDDATGVATGSSASLGYSVPGGSPFKVSLVWSDAAAAEAAASTLVNDLDLVVTAPDGTTTYLGNVFSGGWSTGGGLADDVNNVENVYVQSAAAGVWSVDVVGANVPVGGSQPFALVVDGATVGPTNAAPTATIDAPADGSTVSGNVAIEITATDAEDTAGTLTVEWSVDGGATWSPATSGGGTLYTATWDSTTGGDGPVTIEARATDSGGKTGTDSVSVTVDNLPSVDVHVGDLDGSSTSGRGNRWNATVVVTVHDSAESPVANATVSGSWSNGTNGSGSCTTNGSGQCSITKNNIRNAASVQFTVTGVASTVGSYAPGASHDPDGDSDGTTISVNEPA